MFGDPKQREHMMQGVKRAHASAKTPEHLRPHLAKRLEGGSMATAIEPRDGTPSQEATQPVKTIVRGYGRGPIKTIAKTPRYDERPLKTVVGNTARLPNKTTVGNLSKPPLKTITGSTAAPPRKTTAGNLGKGGISPLGMEAADRGPINASNPSTFSAALSPRSDGNLGRSAAPMPAPAQGPPNPSMDYAQPWNSTGIHDGGMGPAAKSMAPTARPRGLGGTGRVANTGPREIQSARGTPRRAAPRRLSQFFGE